MNKRASEEAYLDFSSFAFHTAFAGFSVGASAPHRHWLKCSGTERAYEYVDPKVSMHSKSGGCHQRQESISTSDVLGAPTKLFYAILLVLSILGFINLELIQHGIDFLSIPIDNPSQDVNNVYLVIPNIQYPSIYMFPSSGQPP